MKLKPDLLKKLDQKYAASSLVRMRYKALDIVFKTNDDDPVMLFIGKAGEDGMVKGERYVRTLKRNSTGEVFKDHWDLKVKAN